MICAACFGAQDLPLEPSFNGTESTVQSLNCPLDWYRFLNSTVQKLYRPNMLDWHKTKSPLKGTHIFFTNVVAALVAECFAGWPDRMRHPQSNQA